MQIKLPVCRWIFFVLLGCWFTVADARAQNYQNQQYQNQQYSNNNQGLNNSNFGNQNSFGNMSNTGTRSRSRRSRDTTDSNTGTEQTGSRSNSNRLNNRSRSSSSTPSPAGAGLTPPANTEGTPQAAPSSQSSGASYAGKRTILSPGRQADANLRTNATLYLETAEPYAVIQQPVSVAVVLSNKTNLEYDHMSILLQYDPADWKPVTGQDVSGQWQAAAAVPIAKVEVKNASGMSGLKNESVSSKKKSEDREKSGFAGDPRFEIVKNSIDPVAGLIQVELKGKGDPATNTGVVMHIPFLPLRETTAHLKFLFVDPKNPEATDAAATALTLGKEDQLGTRFSMADGTVDLDLPIYETLEKAKQAPTIKKSDELGDENSSDDEPLALVLVPRETDIHVGDLVNVDVVLKNPKKSPVDRISMLVAYNPRVFDAVDGDTQTKGFNVADEDYKSQFPFDFTLLNHIDEEKGIIDYRKKAMRRAVHGDGVVATIRLRAVRPTKKTTFRLLLNESGEDPTTGIFYHDQDRLGDTKDPLDGITTCSLGVNATTAFLEKMNLSSNDSR